MFRWIFDELVHRGDKYYHLADFPSYVEVQKEISEAYQKDEIWCRKSILNVARIGKFSSDRTVLEYARDIWHIGPYEKSVLKGVKPATRPVAAISSRAVCTERRSHPGRKTRTVGNWIFRTPPGEQRAYARSFAARLRPPGRASSTEHLHQRKPQILPRVEPAEQRTHVPNAVSPELQRRTGAGGFVRSSTEQHDLAVAGNLCCAVPPNLPERFAAHPATSADRAAGPADAEGR